MQAEEHGKAERAKPVVVNIGKREVISSGYWNDELVADYVMINGVNSWLTIGDLAKFAWTSNTLANKARARKYLGRLWALLLMRGQLLVVEYGERGRAQAVKIYDPESEQDQQALNSKLQKLKHRGELTEDQYVTAMGLLQPKAA